jgi:type IV pilus assembly protein PilY1
LLKRDPGENNPTVATPTNRTIYTTDGSNTTLLNFEIAECSALQSALGTSGTCDSTDGLLDETEKLIRFVRGYYVDDPAFPRSANRNFDAVSGYGNDDGTADPDEQWKIADALHSNPLLVGVPNMVYGYADYWSDYVDVQDGRDLVAYFMTNDGMLHAIQLASIDTNGVYQPTSEAKELWAFIPHAALAKLEQTRDAEHEYVADGLLRAIDVKVDTGDGQGEIWRTVLFGLGGRDNTYIFGMDVTDPDNPVLMWEMDADSAGRIGTTISAPALGRIDSDNDGNLDKWVAVVGSGYDLDYLDNYESSTAWLTVIDLADGAILKQLKVSDKVGNVLTDLAVLRNATSGAIEKVYFGDYYGALWRVTGDRIGRLDATAPLADGDTLSDVVDASHIYCDLLYKPSDYATTSVPDDPDFPVTAQPRIAKGMSSNEYWVYFGSGDYDEYDTNYPYQSFFGLKDKINTAVPYQFTDLTDMTFSTGTNAAAASWYIQLGQNADSASGQTDIDFINNTTTGATTAKNRNERVMKRAEVYGGFVFFTTYEPLNVPCGGGKSRFYAVGYRSGAFQSDLFLNLEDSSGNSLTNVRSVELETGGVPSQPMIMEGQSGGGTAVASGVTTSSSGGIEKVELNPQAFSTALDILLWREKR